MKYSAIFLTCLLLGCTASPVFDKRANLRAAAEQGDKEAQYLLGKSRCCGFGAGHDTTSALKWLCRAALQGHGGAQYEIGRYYGLRADTYYGPSLRQDLIYAYTWYSLAARQGIQLAAAEREALANDLLDQEIRLANRRMEAWRELGCKQS